ncbi:hypothetical protein KY284_032268 [Solanum tuberosum]|nr:hypothetical protein KY284_032268 [Solanum tuberosum]
MGQKLLATATHIQKKEQHRRHIPATVRQQVEQKMNKSHQVVDTAAKGEMKNHLGTHWMEEWNKKTKGYLPTEGTKNSSIM